MIVGSADIREYSDNIYMYHSTSILHNKKHFQATEDVCEENCLAVVISMSISVCLFSLFTVEKFKLEFNETTVCFL